MTESCFSSAGSAVLVAKDPRRLFSDKQRQAIYLAANGRCQQCGIQLEAGWHADHVVPHSKGGPTDIANGAALCPTCNITKSNKMSSLSAMQKQLALQADEIERLKTLPELWGPQCMHVDVFLQTVSRLTKPENERLTNAYCRVFLRGCESGPYVRWDEALDATYIVWEAGNRRSQIWAAEDAYRQIVRRFGEAGLYALRALVLRDLIGQYGYRQWHYDTHTRPWRNVIGPVHPDD
jgi:hypothetical protein